MRQRRTLKTANAALSATDCLAFALECNYLCLWVFVPVCKPLFFLYFFKTQGQNP